MKLRFDYTDLDRRFQLPERIADLVKKVGEEEKVKLGEIIIIFVTRERILEINKAYLKHYYFTDVITFSNSVKHTISGDLFVCVEQVLENSARYGTIREEELVRVMIHGILHLIGFDDKSLSDARIMRKREEYYLTLAREMNLFLNYEFTI